MAEEACLFSLKKNQNIVPDDFVIDIQKLQTNIVWNYFLSRFKMRSISPSDENLKVMLPIPREFRFISTGAL